MNCTKCGEPLDGLHILDGCPKRTSEDVTDMAEEVVETALQDAYDGFQHGVTLTAVNALDEAGLLEHPLPTREEIAMALHADQCPEDPYPDECCTCDGTHYDRLADVVLDLLKGQDQ